jgi:hypothetical protein
MNDKGNNNLKELIKRYELAKCAEGKSPKTIKGYRELLLSFCRYDQEHNGGASLSGFTIDIVREYIIYLQTRPKFQGHPFTPARGEGLSVESVRDHVRTLKCTHTRKGFSLLTIVINRFRLLLIKGNSTNGN